MKAVVLLAVLVMVTIGNSQINISNKALGYQFNSPKDWIHQDLQNGNHVFGHKQIPGLIAVMVHDYNDIEQVKRAVQKEGIEDENMYLKLVSSIESFNENGLKGIFEGYLEGAQVKATVISLFSPYGGGLSIFVVTSKEKYDTSYEQLAKSIANTVVFKKPVESDLVKQWKTFLRNRKLTYYNTTDDVAEKMIYILYDNGWFVFHDESFYATTDEYTDKTQYFSSLTTNKNAGRWTITGNDTNATLNLNYNSSGTVSKIVQMKEGSQSQILLDGKRFFTESIY